MQFRTVSGDFMILGARGRKVRGFGTLIVGLVVIILFVHTVLYGLLICVDSPWEEVWADVDRPTGYAANEVYALVAGGVTAFAPLAWIAGGASSPSPPLRRLLWAVTLVAVVEAVVFDVIPVVGKDHLAARSAASLVVIAVRVLAGACLGGALVYELRHGGSTRRRRTDDDCPSEGRT